MGTQKVTDKQIDMAMRRLKSTGLVAKELGVHPRPLAARLRRIERDYGIVYERVKAVQSGAEMMEHLASIGAQSQRTPPPPRVVPVERAYVSQPEPAKAFDPIALDDAVRGALLRRPRTIADLATSNGVSAAQVSASLARLEAAHLNIHRSGDSVSIERVIPPMEHDDDLHTYTSNAEGYYRIGIISDNHFGSRHCRLDVNDELYDWFQARKVDRVYNAGNYIEGEFRHNKFELTHVGMQQQVDFFCERYPKREGITTYFIAGDDHEGWYQQDTGINIGRFTETNAREKWGRDDLRYIGYVEAFIALRHAITGAESKMLVQHPGGGSSYATSYAPQKSVESLQSGEKPAVWIFGHWHKVFALLIRGVICIGAGCTKDLDTFGRKKKLQYQIAGTILELWQNPQTGAIEEWRVQHKQFFDRGYHNNQFDSVGTRETM